MRCARGWWGQDSNLRRQSQRVYSPSPLTTRTPHQVSMGAPAAGAGDSSRLPARGGPWRPPASGAPARLGGLAQALQLLERAVLDLAHALARDVERAADLLEGPRTRAGQAEAHLDHLAFTR